MADAVIDLASLDTSTDSTETSTDVGAGIPSSAENTQENQDSQQQQPNQTETTEQFSGKAIRDAQKALAQLSPEHSKILKEMADARYREVTGWQKVFETPQKAAEAKSIIESAGGIEGIAQQHQRIQQYDQQDEMLKSGSPEVLDAMFKDFAEGAIALAPHYLSKLEAINPQALQAAVGPYAVNMLIQAGLQSHIDSMTAETDPARAKQMAQQLGEWLKGQAQNAQQLRQNAHPQQDPRADRLKAKETELQQKEETIFRTSVTERVNSSVAPQLAGVVDQYAKQYKLNETQKAHYRESLEQAVIKEMNADQAYMRQAEIRNAAKGRTPEAVAQFIAGEFTRRAKDKAFEVAKSIYGSPRAAAAQLAGTGVVKAGSPQTAPGGGPIRISARPADSQMDLSRPGADLLLIKGQGYLKDGRFVTWRQAGS